jgi:hypothetical protein
MKTIAILSIIFCLLSPLLASMQHDTDTVSETPEVLVPETVHLATHLRKGYIARHLPSTSPVCETFDRTPFYSGAMSQTKGTITVTLQTQYQAGKNWIISSTAPISSITITSNGGTQNRTGQTLINGEYGADIITAVICTTAAASPTSSPTKSPTKNPTFSPSAMPTPQPSFGPSQQPTQLPVQSQSGGGFFD